MKKDVVYICIIAIVVVLFLFREGCNQVNNDKLISDISNYKTESETYKTKLGLEVNTNRALALETQSQIKSLFATNDTLKQWVSKFKEIKSGVIIKETTIIKEVPVPFDKPIPCDFKPFPAKKITKDYQFFTTISNTGLTIDSLKIPNEQKIIVGEKKSGFLNLKSKLVVEVNNSNPYIQTSNISGFVFDPKKKMYQKTWFKVLVGVGIGAVGVKAGSKYVNNIIGR